MIAQQFVSMRLPVVLLLTVCAAGASPTTASGQDREPKSAVGLPAVPDSFPRRLLAIGIHTYPYCNPLNSGGSKEHGFYHVARQLGGMLYVPQNQVAVLSDRAPTPIPPTKDVVEKAITDFIESSRDQDRIVLLFVGHAVELDDTPYLVPLLGEPDKKETLIPLDWLYGRLAKCKARQKLLILDICRFDPVRGAERGEVARLGAGFIMALAKPPKGIQVLTSCGSGQYSLELASPRLGLEGGVFLGAIVKLFKEGALADVKPQPEDSLPVQDLYRVLRRRTAPVISAYFTALKAKKESQTPQLFGSESPSRLKFDPNAPAPRRLRIELPEEFKDGLADPAEISAVLDIIKRIRPAQSDHLDKWIRESLPPYPKGALAEYKDDGKDSKLRAAVRDAVKLLGSPEQRLLDSIPLPPENEIARKQFHKNVQMIQQNIKGTAASLGEMADTLRGLAEDRGKECKLWQANYDYVLARLELRQAWLLEYCAMLDRILEDKLPPFDKTINRGFKMVAVARISDDQAKKLAEQARGRLDELARTHKGTPWALIAGRDKASNIGLEWMAI
jgi:hypothetical protein